MDADHKPMCVEVRPADSLGSYAQGKEDPAVMTATRPLPVLPVALRDVHQTAAVAQTSSPAVVGGPPTNPAVAGLRKAFLRHATQASNYRQKQLRELAAAAEE